MAAVVRGSGAFFSNSRKSKRRIVNVGSTKDDALVSWKNHDSRQQSRIVLREQSNDNTLNSQGWHPLNSSIHVQASNISLRWWEKNIPTPNMIEIRSADELVDSLQSAGDSLVILDFYSPGCGGCRLMHPKICGLAESNPDALFLKVNYEELRPMCESLNVHVLPFFRFYRGARGRVCSFSCTNTTISKFKDALAKHGGGGERCSTGTAKGLEESELLSLTNNRETHFSYGHAI